MTDSKPKCDRHLDMEERAIRADMRIEALEKLSEEMKEDLWGNGKDGLKSNMKSLMEDRKDRTKWDNRIWAIICSLGVGLAMIAIKLWMNG